jgi:hypothetical protein
LLEEILEAPETSLLTFQETVSLFDRDGRKAYSISWLELRHFG